MSIPTLRLAGTVASIFEGEQRSQIEALLPAYLLTRRWFGGKARTQRGVGITDIVPIPTAAGSALLLLVRVEYLDADAETYALPVTFATDDVADRLESESPGLILARTLEANGEQRGVIYDATGSADFASALLDGIARQRSFEGRESRIECSPTSAFEELDIRGDTPLVPKLSTAEQSNSAIRFGDRLLLKLFRRPGNGVNPDLEIGRALTARRFKNAPPLAGSIEYHTNSGEHRTLGVLHGFVAGAVDGWEYTLKALGRYYERVRNLGEPEPSGEAGLLLGEYLESAALLGRRTAEMHLALAGDREAPAFAPEPFTPHDQRELCQAMRDLALQNLLLLKRKLGTLDGEQRELAAAVIAAEPEIVGRFDRLAGLTLSGVRIRVHGDYHLGQTLYTGSDFFIVDFEGEPSVPLSERRMKRTPFRDLAGMLRSFDYAANAALLREAVEGAIPTADLPRLTAWAGRWTRWVSAAYMESYLSQPGIAGILPASAAERGLLLETCLFGKALYELGYEVNNRPAWLPIPCRGILALLR